MENVAYQLFVEDRFVFTFTELEQIISETIHLLDTWLPRSKQIGPSDMIHIVESDQGLWIRRSGNCYSFSHLTLQEFLTARHIHNAGLQDYILQKRLYDDLWREVIVMLCCYPRGEEIIDKIANEVRSLASRLVSLRPVVDWLQEFVPGGGLSSQFVALGLILCCMHTIRSGRIERAERIPRAVEGNASYVRRSLRRNRDQSKALCAQPRSRCGVPPMRCSRRAGGLSSYPDDLDSASNASGLEAAAQIARVRLVGNEHTGSDESLCCRRWRSERMSCELEGESRDGDDPGHVGTARPEPNPRNIQQITGFDCNNNYIRSGECELLVQCLYGSTLVEVCSISAGIRETRWQNLLSGPPESRGTRSFLLNYDEDVFEPRARRLSPGRRTWRSEYSRCNRACDSGPTGS